LPKDFEEREVTPVHTEWDKNGYERPDCLREKPARANPVKDIGPGSRERANDEYRYNSKKLK